MNRIRAGFLLTRNPFNHNQVRRVSLLPRDVDAIVFWTRNALPLVPFLPELNERGFSYYFQYTITGYSRTLEKSVPHPLKAIESFKALSSQVGADRVIWRYDPILLSNLVPIDEHKRLFSKIASALTGKTKRVVISFSDFYKKTENNLKNIDNLIYSDITQQANELGELCDHMKRVSAQAEMEIVTCAEEIDIDEIPHGKCIDEKLINEVFGLSLGSDKDKGQREACGCIKSVDIGMYNTCLHGCSYCYATYNESRVLTNRRNHDIESPFLVGGVEGIDPKVLATEIIQRDLF